MDTEEIVDIVFEAFESNKISKEAPGAFMWLCADIWILCECDKEK